MRSSKEIIDIILEKRGLTDPEDVKEYFSSDPKRTYDPFDLKNMREGVDLIMDSISRGDKICIYGDYDADGVTSICILYQGLSHLTDELCWYIPSRFTEGYGLNRQAVEKLAEEGVRLMITVDCGITSMEEVARAEDLGMKVIVTDHHAPGESIPDCIVIDPKQEGDGYPNKDLAGCGVAFKLLQAIQRSADLPKSVVSDALDMVCLGTVGDIVNLMGENRTIVKYGLRKINRGERQSLVALARAISLKEIRSENISFALVPHINAAGRMGDAGDAVKLFLSEEGSEIERQVDALTSYNSARRRAQEEAYEKCLSCIEGDEDIVFLKIPGIHEGIAGIAAGKLKEHTSRPVVLTTPTEDGKLKGTGRSIEGLDIHELLGAHSRAFLKFGGHKSACGFTMEEAGFQDLKTAVEEDVRKIFDSHPKLIEDRPDYEMELDCSEASMELADAIQDMEPFGEGNPAPTFAIRKVNILYPRYMGNDNEHVRFTAINGNSRINCVLFRKAAEYEQLIRGEAPVDIFGSLKSQVWNGEKRLQFIVEEMESGE